MQESELILVAGIQPPKEYPTIASGIIRGIAYIIGNAVLLDLDPSGDVAFLLSNATTTTSHPRSATNWLLGRGKLPSLKSSESLHALVIEPSAYIPVRQPKRSITQLLKALLRRYSLVIVSSPNLALSTLYSTPFSHRRWLIAITSGERGEFTSLMILHAISSGFKPVSIIVASHKLKTAQASTALGMLVLRLPPTDLHLDKNLPLVARHLAQLRESKQHRTLIERISGVVRRIRCKSLKPDQQTLAELLATRLI